MRKPSLIPAAVIKRNAIITLLQSSGVPQILKTNGHTNSQIAKGTVSPKKPPSPQLPAKATSTKAIPNPTLLHTATAFPLKLNTNGEINTQIPKTMLTHLLAGDVCVVRFISFRMTQTNMVKMRIFSRQELMTNGAGVFARSRATCYF